MTRSKVLFVLMALLMLSAVPGWSASVAFVDANDEPLSSLTLAENAQSFQLIVLLTASECGGKLLAEPGLFKLETRESGTASGGAAPGGGNDFQLGVIGLTSYPPLIDQPAPVVRLAANVRAQILFDDDVFEGSDPETFEIAFTSPQVLECDEGGVRSPLTLTFGPPLTVAIEDDETPPEISIGDLAKPEGDEGETTFDFAVTLSRPSQLEVSTDWSTEDGTATSRQRSGPDFAAAQGTLTFPAYETVASIPIQVHGDATVEPDETFAVVLGKGVNGTVTGSRGRGTILNDDTSAASIDDVRVPEGGTADFTVTLSKASDLEVAVRWATRDRTASSAGNRPDYVAARGEVVFPPGTTGAEVSVRTLDDAVDEDAERFEVVLESARNAELGDPTGVATIVDDDREPVLSIDDVRGREGDEGTTPFRFTVELSAASDRTVSVRYRTRPGTARRGDDFEQTAGQLTFAPGETSQTVAVPVVGDLLAEDDETFSVVLVSATNTVIGDGEGLGTILDDDENAPTTVRAVSGGGQAGRLGQSLANDLVAEVVGREGAPVAGVRIAWTVAAGDATLAAARSVTGDDGRSANQVTLGARSGAVTIRASVDGVDGGAEFVLNARVTTAEGLDPVAGPVAAALETVCARGDLTPELRAICLGVASVENPNSALRALAPEELNAQGNAAVEAPKVQLGNVGARLAALRSGARVTNQIALRLGDETLSGTMIAQVFSRRERRELDAGDLLRRAQRRLLYPGAGTDATRQDDAGGPAPAGTAELGGRWGFFLNGTIGEGRKPTTVLETGFDLDTTGVTAGVDYRLRDDCVLGLALGYVSDDVELRHDGGSVDIEGTSLSLYGTWYRKQVWVDGIVSYGRNSLDTRRGIDFLGTRYTASGSPDGEQVAAGLGVGYDAAFGGLTLSGFGRADWVDADIDAFAETGAPGFDLAIDAQQVESLLAQAGIQLSYAVSVRWGVVLPALRLAQLHEFRDDARPLTARFVDDMGATRFTLFGDDPDRDFSNLGLGVSAVFKHGRQAFVFYEKDLGRDDLSYYRITAGFRLEF